MTATRSRLPGFRVAVSLVGVLVLRAAAFAQANLPVIPATFLSVWPGQQQQEPFPSPPRHP